MRASLRIVRLAPLVAVALLLLSGVATAGPTPGRDPTFVPLDQLTPRLAQAGGDRPSVTWKPCNARDRSAVRLCRFGDRGADRVVVAFGDSHMVQWFPALRWAARADHFRLVWATKPGCPAAKVRKLDGDTGRPDSECWNWRTSLFERIRALPRVDLALMASSSWHVLLAPGSDSVVTDPAQRAELYREGTARSIRAIRPVARRILVIRDTPRIWVDPVACLRGSGGDTRPCSRPRTAALLPGIWAAERGLAARYDRVEAAQFTRAFCTATRCRPVTHNLVLRYRDDNHLTKTFAAVMSATVGARVQAALRRSAG